MEGWDQNIFCAFGVFSPSFMWLGVFDTESGEQEFFHSAKGETRFFGIYKGEGTISITVKGGSEKIDDGPSRRSLIIKNDSSLH